MRLQRHGSAPPRSARRRSAHAALGDLTPALVEGTLLAAYRFDRYKGGADDEDQPRRGPQRLIVAGADDAIAAEVAVAEIVATAQNAARDLQNTPANDMTPSVLGERALALAAELEGLSATADGPDEMAERGMGSFLAVAQGSAVEPRLITLRYDGPDATGPVLGLVGKAVTFDSGGLSLKPAARMHEMKYDMSGGAAVLEAIGAIARLKLPIHVVAVIGSTENLPGGAAIKPGDIVTAMDGTTIEINNTDAEGRLVLADCLTWARERGAERLVDLATLTGAIVVALGRLTRGCSPTTTRGRRRWRPPVRPRASGSGACRSTASTRTW